MRGKVPRTLACSGVNPKDEAARSVLMRTLQTLRQGDDAARGVAASAETSSSEPHCFGPLPRRAGGSRTVWTVRAAPSGPECGPEDRGDVEDRGDLRSKSRARISRDVSRCPEKTITPRAKRRATKFCHQEEWTPSSQLSVPFAGVE
ncbi:unnamed protein product [Gadus morhua 'NCC']